MTISDPSTFTLQVSVTAVQMQQLTLKATQHNFATVSEFLVSFALGETSQARFAPPEPPAPPTGSVNPEIPVETPKKGKG
jgi:hypothetical protein